MTRNWKTGKSIEEEHEIHLCWKDLILEDTFGITENDWNTVVNQTTDHIRSWGKQEIAGRISYIIDLLMPPLQTLWQGKNSELSYQLFRWLPSCSLPGATVADHALTASAIAYCLGYDNGFQCDNETLNRLRLSALTSTWKDEGLHDIYDTLWCEDSAIEPKADSNDVREQIVHAAKTVASKRISVDSQEMFTTHPLKHYSNLNIRQVGLISGGATKIKGYVFESAKLPEIRGASTLLDRINIEYLPALLGRKSREDPKRSADLREDFRKRTGHSLAAQECIIYSAGGDCLAFTPASVVHDVADEIERIYSQETLVANSVAVAATFDLLELQYGLNPEQFWVEKFREAVKNEGTEIGEIVKNYFGGKKDKNFYTKKVFGELATKLAMEKFKRREGNQIPKRQTCRDAPTFVEQQPYAQTCNSCDRRPVIYSISADRQLCEACLRKYIIGRASKKRPESNELVSFTRCLNWEPANRDDKGKYQMTDWITLFHEYVTSDSDDGDPDGPNDLSDIAKGSDPEGFIAFIYADGNNMGGYLENIATPAQYRQFSERVFVAMQKATFEALAKLKPIRIKGDSDRYIFPFEIISIGGDDLILIVPGDKALKIAHEIGTNFDRIFMSRAVYETAECPDKAQRYQRQQWTDAADEKSPQFSMSLGFVIANEHTPVAFMEDLAGKLLKSAKKRAKELKTEAGYLGGTVDFISLKSLSMITSELGDFRKKFYKTDEKNVLTMRPFTLHELDGFIQTVKAFKEKKFPRSQLYQLRQSLKLGRATSTLDYLYFRSRLGDDGKLLQQELEGNWQGVPDNNNNMGPWYTMLHGDKYETLLLDLIESYDFIPESEGKNEEDTSDEFND